MTFHASPRHATTASYAFDPELADAAPLFVPFDPDDHSGARAAMNAMAEHLPQYEPEHEVRVAATTVPGPAGEVPVRIYSPTTPGESTHPGILYLHWGGFVNGSLDMVHPSALRMADQIGAVVVSVDYRLAPEHPYPAAIEDSYAALVWLAENSTHWGVDPERLALVGESAGGGLAAGLALVARDRGGPPTVFQALGFPQLDDRIATVSARTFVDTPMWDRRSLEASWRDYLGPDHSDEHSIESYAAPARATELSGLPPAFISACEFDPLRDEDINYAQQLLDAGVSVELHVYPGTFHASTAVGTAQISRRMVADQIAALTRALATPPASDKS